ncbi:hypothetical protein [Amycolatopsis sp. cmx-8-4]|uniref:hypothetical protein n=1 Tax=Amycolatopsis sp. cmx-8-4 TaxID=2790947 RepID=UPI00397C9FD3
MAADEVARLWDAHVRAPFPPTLRGAEIAAIDMVLLDAHTAGCISSWLSSGGRLGAWRRAAIASCLAELNTVLPLLTDPAQAAFSAPIITRGCLALTGGDTNAVDVRSCR